MPPLIDTHLHIWDPGAFDIPWLDGSLPVLERVFTMKDYADATTRFPPTKSIYIEVDVAPSDRLAEFDGVIELLSEESNPLCAAIVAADPAGPDLDDWITRAQEVQGVPGFRMVLHQDDKPPGACLDPRFIEGVRRIGEAGMHFELCMRMEELGDAVQLADAAHRTPLVLNHCGNPRLDGRDLAGWREEVGRLAERENVVCKVSGLLENADPDWSLDQIRTVIEHVRAVFGRERILFGSNWPVCNLRGGYGRWQEVLEDVTDSWTEEERAALFFENAVRFYKLG